MMMEFTVHENPERQALESLQKEGVTEIFGAAIDSLMEQAGKREQARQIYMQAYEGYQGVVASGADDLSARATIKAATEQLVQAQQLSEQTRYPDGDAFSVLRSMVEGQKIEIQLLQDAIGLWWWRQFNDAFVEAQLRLPLPANERSIQDAEEAAKSLPGLLDAWKQSSGESSAYYQQAEKAYGEITDWQKKIVEKRAAAQKSDYDYWLQFAQEQLDARDERDPDPLTALAALSRAKNLHEPEYDEGVEIGFGGVEEQARAAFAQLQKKHLISRVNGIVQDISQALGQPQPPKPDDELTAEVDHRDQVDILSDYLAAQVDHRDQVDILSDYLAVLDIEVEKDTRDLVRLRQKNLLEARRILNDISVMSDKRYDFRVLRLLEEAQRNDPDNREIIKKKEDHENRCINHRTEFHEKKRQFDTSLRSEDAIRAFCEVSAALEEMKALMGHYEEPPEEWKEVIDRAEQEMENCKKHRDLQAEAQNLVDAWGARESDVADILERTEKLSGLGNVSQANVTAIKAKIKERLEKASDFWADVRWIPKSSLYSMPQPKENAE